MDHKNGSSQKTALGPPLALQEHFRAVERIHKSVAESIASLSEVMDTSHNDEFRELTSQLKSVWGEFRKTVDYFQNDEAFTKEYNEFMAREKREACALLQVGEWEIRTYDLYFQVISHGGYVTVSNQMTWDRIWRKVGKKRITQNTPPAQPETTTQKANGTKHTVNGSAATTHKESRTTCDNFDNFFSFKLESELRELYLQFIYPYEFYKRKTLEME